MVAVNEILSRCAEDAHVDPVPTEAELAAWLSYAEPPMLDGWQWRVEAGEMLLVHEIEPEVAAEFAEAGIFRFTLKVPQLHEMWLHGGEAGPHPVIRLIEGWSRRPKVVQPERRGTAIMPEPLRHARPAPAVRSLPTPTAITPVGDLGQATLPGLEPPESRIVPALPLYAPPSNTRESRVLHMAQAICMGAVMSYPLGDRVDAEEVRMSVALGDFKAWLFPGAWKRRSAIPMIADALRTADQFRVHVPELRRYWRLMAADDVPDSTARLGDEFRLRVRLPPGSERGPLIDTRPLPMLRTTNMGAWRAWFRLAYIWDAAKGRNGGRRVYATRPKARRDFRGRIMDAGGELVTVKQGAPFRRKDGSLTWPAGDHPTTDARHPRAVIEGAERNPRADVVPLLTPTELVQLAYDDAPREGEGEHWMLPAITEVVFRRRLHRAKAALRHLESFGLVVIERRGQCWRVLEPRPAA